MAERDVVLKLILQVDGAKIPALDTKEAEESLRKFAERAKQVNREVAQAAASASAGGYGGVSIPTAATRAAASAGSLPRGFRRLSTPTVGPLGGVPRAYGPVSDPGSYARPSQSSYGGYQDAMFYQSYDAVQNRIRNIAAGAPSMAGAGRAFNQARLGGNQVRESVGGLAASLALLDMALKQSQGTILDTAKITASAFSTLAHGATFAQGGGRLAMGAGRLGGMALRGGATLGRLGGAAIGGGLQIGGAMLGGYAGGMMGSAGGAIAAIGGGIGAGAVAGLGALAVGAGAYGYYRYQDYRARQRGLELDQQIYDTNLSRSQRREFDRIGGIGTAAERMARAGAFDSIRGGPDFFQRSNNASTQIRRNIAGLAAGRDAAASVGEYQKAAEYSRQIERSEQARLQLSQQRLDVMEREGRLLLEQVQMQSNLAQTTRSNAQAVASAAGRIGPSGRAQLRNLARRSMNERNALAIEGITGYREGSPQSEFLNRLGQSQVDDPALRPFFGNQARTSSEMGKLDKEIAELKTKEQNIVERLEQVIIDRQEVMLRFADAIERSQKQTDELLQRMNNQEKATTQGPYIPPRGR